MADQNRYDGNRYDVGRADPSRADTPTNINQQFANKAVVANFKAIREVQQEAAKQGETLSFGVAKALLKEHQEREKQEQLRVAAATAKAQPEWIRDGNGLTGISAPRAPLGPILPLTDDDPFMPPFELQRIVREDDSGALTTCVVQVNANIYQGKVPISDLQPYVP